MGCERVAERTLAMFRSSNVTGNATRTPCTMTNHNKEDG
jgi:hypothetical protein